MYKFIKSSSGEIVPQLTDNQGVAHTLHSTRDPVHEAKRLMDSLEDEGFIILLGFGGGYYAQAALEREQTSLVLVIDYDKDSVQQLLDSRDYSKILNDPRFYLLVDPAETDIEQFMLDNYQPALCEGIRMLPLRARTAADTAHFNAAALTVDRVIGKISSDYSVQAYFGMKWFSNTIRNIKKAEENHFSLPIIKRAAVTAAGPSLNIQIPLLKERRKNLFLIATDTSLPCLLSQDIIPDAVVSIDCQHISYYHFMAGLPKETLLFMDLAGPPLVASRSKNTLFFSGSHPLTNYITKTWLPLPQVDTSGGNVTYACVSLAEKLGAQTIELYGADFSYPQGLSYAKGTYIHPYFEMRQTRLSPVEAKHSAFLFRGTLSKKMSDNNWYYESHSLKLYREMLEEKCGNSDFELIPQQGLGAPIQVPVKKTANRSPGSSSWFINEKVKMKSEDFLASYAKKIQLLHIPTGKYIKYINDLEADERLVLFTLLPTAAALKRRNPEWDAAKLVENTKSHCICKIEKGLA